MKNTRNLKIFYDFEFIEGVQRKYLFGIPLWKTKPTIEMISLGMVFNDTVINSKEYLINKEFNIDEAWNRYDGYHEIALAFESDPNHIPEKNYWIRDNILNPIWKELEYRDFQTEHKHIVMTKTDFLRQMPRCRKFTKRRFKQLIQKYGNTRSEIKDIILTRTKLYDSVSLYGYYSSYDHVLMSWIFGKMIDLPKNFNKFSYDLKQYLNDYLKVFVKSNTYFANDTFWFNGEKKERTSLSDVLKYVKKHTNYPQENPEEKHHALADAIWIGKLYEYLKRQGLNI